MAEADIDALAVLADGSAYGPQIRGAMATLKTRARDLAQQALYSMGGSGVATLNWANGNHHKLVSNGFNVTDISTVGNPAVSTIRSGTLEVHNTGVVDITVASPTLGVNGLETAVTIPAGKSRLFFLVESGTVET